MSNDDQLYTQDTLDNDHEICYLCDKIVHVDELEEVDVDAHGNKHLVCGNCIQNGESNAAIE